MRANGSYPPKDLGTPISATSDTLTLGSPHSSHVLWVPSCLSKSDWNPSNC